MKKKARLALAGGVVAIAGASLVSFGGSGCLNCTAVGCSDGYTATVRTADDAWPPGSYTVDVTADGKSAQCAFVWDGQVSGAGFPDVLATCDHPFATIEFDARIKETTVMDENGTTISGTPIPGQFQVVVTVDGTPEKVSLAVSRDGALLGQKSFEPDYESFDPNGTFCPPSCDEASTEWKLPAAT